MDQVDPSKKCARKPGGVQKPQGPLCFACAFLVALFSLFLFLLSCLLFVLLVLFWLPCFLFCLLSWLLFVLLVFCLLALLLLLCCVLFPDNQLLQ